MRRIFKLFLLLVACGSMMVSCRSGKDVSDGYRNQYFGIKVSKDDNRALYKEVDGWIGVPYKYGGNSKRGVDCSGFVGNIYSIVYGVKLQRSSELIFKKNCKKIKKGKLEEGDLVFFKSGKKKKINHVGIYLKDNKFVHASASRGVMVSSLDEDYYKRNFMNAGRVKR